MLKISIAEGLKTVGRDEWNSVANPADRPFDPFLGWDYLEALEQSGAASAGEGWAPHHLLVRDGDGVLAGAMPLYLKGHSYGEYVFDHAWAEAYGRAGGRWYPKLLAAVPFTPVTGRRRLSRPDPGSGRGPKRAETEQALLDAAISLAADNRISGLHINFPDADEWHALGEAGMLLRKDTQYVFENRNYRDFDDFLSTLSSEKRKNLRKERARAREGLTIRALTGSAIEERDWDHFFAFYMDTGSRKWGRPYLNRATFALFHARLRDHILLILADRGGVPIAGALNFIGSDALYGRYWGASEFVSGLHFELCYYQAIDFALARGLSRVEAGAQGDHKLARGYEPKAVYSAHWIADPGFRAALAAFLAKERRAVDAQIAALGDYTPFRKGPAQDPD